MAEDSGAFKTNPANSCQVSAFVKFRERRCSEASPVWKRPFKYERGIHRADF
jgi:hypothetical protein